MAVSVYVDEYTKVGKLTKDIETWKKVEKSATNQEQKKIAQEHIAKNTKAKAKLVNVIKSGIGDLSLEGKTEISKLYKDSEANRYDNLSISILNDYLDSSKQIDPFTTNLSPEDPMWMKVMEGKTGIDYMSVVKSTIAVSAVSLLAQAGAFSALTSGLSALMAFNPVVGVCAIVLGSATLIRKARQLFAPEINKLIANERVKQKFAEYSAETGKKFDLSPYEGKTTEKGENALEQNTPEQASQNPAEVIANRKAEFESKVHEALQNGEKIDIPQDNILSEDTYNKIIEHERANLKAQKQTEKQIKKEEKQAGPKDAKTLETLSTEELLNIKKQNDGKTNGIGGLANNIKKEHLEKDVKSIFNKIAEANKNGNQDEVVKLREEYNKKTAELKELNEYLNGLQAETDTASKIIQERIDNDPVIRSINEKNEDERQAEEQTKVKNEELRASEKISYKRELRQRVNEIIDAHPDVTADLFEKEVKDLETNYEYSQFDLFVGEFGEYLDDDEIREIINDCIAKVNSKANPEDEFKQTSFSLENEVPENTTDQQEVEQPKEEQTSAEKQDEFEQTSFSLENETPENTTAQQEVEQPKEEPSLADIYANVSKADKDEQTLNAYNEFMESYKEILEAVSDGKQTMKNVEIKKVIEDAKNKALDGISKTMSRDCSRLFEELSDLADHARRLLNGKPEKNGKDVIREQLVEKGFTADQLKEFGIEVEEKQ